MKKLPDTTEPFAWPDDESPPRQQAGAPSEKLELGRTATIGVVSMAEDPRTSTSRSDVETELHYAAHGNQAFSNEVAGDPFAAELERSVRPK